MKVLNAIEAMNAEHWKNTGRRPTAVYMTTDHLEALRIELFAMRTTFMHQAKGSSISGLDIKIVPQGDIEVS